MNKKKIKFFYSPIVSQKEIDDISGKCVHYCFMTPYLDGTVEYKGELENEYFSIICQYGAIFVCVAEREYQLINSQKYFGHIKEIEVFTKKVENLFINEIEKAKIAEFASKEAVDVINSNVFSEITFDDILKFLKWKKKRKFKINSFYI